MKLSRTHFRVVFGVAGLVFLVIAFSNSFEQAQGLRLPGPWSLGAAIALLVGALVCAGISWVVLFAPERGRAELFTVFFQAQPGKYIPGGVWQAAMQIGLSRGPELGLGTASIAFIVHSLTQLVAGLSLGSLIAIFETDLTTSLRVVAGSGLLSLLLLRREWMTSLITVVRRIPRAQFMLDDIPVQRSILISTAWSVVVLICSGAAFAIIAGHFGIETSPISLVLTFSISWAIGFLAVAFPAGIGIREGIMILVLGAGAAAVIAASLVHRILTMFVELVLLAAVEARARWS
jgi:hypothetical protein